MKHATATAAQRAVGEPTVQSSYNPFVDAQPKADALPTSGNSHNPFAEPQPRAAAPVVPSAPPLDPPEAKLPISGLNPAQIDCVQEFLAAAVHHPRAPEDVFPLKFERSRSQIFDYLYCSVEAKHTPWIRILMNNQFIELTLYGKQDTDPAKTFDSIDAMLSAGYVPDRIEITAVAPSILRNAPEPDRQKGSRTVEEALARFELRRAQEAAESSHQLELRDCSTLNPGERKQVLLALNTLIQSGSEPVLGYFDFHAGPNSESVIKFRHQHPQVMPALQSGFRLIDSMVKHAYSVSDSSLTISRVDVGALDRALGEFSSQNRNRSNEDSVNINDFNTSPPAGRVNLLVNRVLDTALEIKGKGRTQSINWKPSHKEKLQASLSDALAPLGANLRAATWAQVDAVIMPYIVAVHDDMKVTMKKGSATVECPELVKKGGPKSSKSARGKAGLSGTGRREKGIFERATDELSLYFPFAHESKRTRESFSR